MSEDRWPAYYDALAGRPPRPFLARALEHAGPPAPDGPGGVALDVGCGDGTDSEALLAAGWRVVAVDASPDGTARTAARCAPYGDRVEVRAATFAGFDPPPCGLVFSWAALPFCPPGDFEAVWARLRAALVPDGWLAAGLFGDRDDWASEPGMTCLTRAALDRLLDGLEVVVLDEGEERRPTALGEDKQWHSWEVLARRP